MERNFKYPIIVEEDDNGTFLITFPDVPEAITFSETKNNIPTHAIDCLDTALAFRIKEKQEIPSPSAVKGRQLVAPSTSIALKIMLYIEMKEQGIKKAQLARMMDCEPTTVDRIVDAKHNSTFKQMDAAFMAMGKHITVGIENRIL